MMQQIPFFEKKTFKVDFCLFTLAKQFQNKTAILQKYFLVSLQQSNALSIS